MMMNPLTSGQLQYLCGSRSELAHRTITALHQSLKTDVPEFVAWCKTAFVHTKKVPSVEAIVRHYKLPQTTPEKMMFTLRTYYALVVKLLAAHHIGHSEATSIERIESGAFFRQQGITNFIDSPDYGWYLSTMDNELAETIRTLRQNIAQLNTQSPPPDVLKTIYQDIFPAALRHSLGEYYTPDWLAEHILDRIGFAGTGRVLDPACGSGTFLVLALRRMQSIGLAQRTILENLVGIDVNPLACLSAKANLLLNLGQPQQNITLPIICRDTILDPPDIDRVDFVVGNPPWINWETLPPTYREQTQHLWLHYNLFPHTGMDSILGKGKKDLALLLTYACIDRHTVLDGKLGFLLTKTVLKTSGAGAGFRQFNIGQTPLQVKSVDDFGRLKIFPPAATHTIALIMQKGQATQYPVPYRIWHKRHKHKKFDSTGSLDAIKAQTRRMHFVAEPISTPDSVWLTGRSEALDAVRHICGKSDYRAHAGAYTGGANAVFWLDVLERTTEGVRVRNIVEGSKRSVPQIETILEPDLIFPLLRGRDVKRWQAQPTAHILIVQNPQTRRGYDIAWMQEHYPRTLAYLRQFEDVLKSRATYRRYFKPNTPFYTMFDIGTYTFAKVKVVWKGFGLNQMRATVITTQENQPIMTNQAMHPFIGLDNEDEAHYLAACLNSVPFELAVLSHAQAGSRSFAQPGILTELRLPRYQPDDAVHRQLAALSRHAHTGEVDDAAIAVAAAQVWGLSPQQLHGMQQNLAELQM